MNIAVLEDYLGDDDIDASLWFVFARALDDGRPPYSKAKKVSPLSVYGDLVWHFPKSWYPPGAHYKSKLNFLGRAWLTNGSKRRLSPGSLLFQQLQEITFALTHLIHIFSDARTTTSLSNTFMLLRKLAIAAEEAGCTSLSQVTPHNIQTIIGLASRSSSQIDQLCLWLDNLVELTRRGYLTDGVKDYDFDVEVGIRNADTSLPKGKQPLTDEQRQELLTKVLLIIDNRGSFIAWTKECLLTGRSSDAVEWLQRIFPETAKKNFRYPDILFQLYQAATGALIGDAIGCRPSELLSIESGFVLQHQSDAFVSLNHFTLDSVTTKGLRNIGGNEKRLRVSELVYQAGCGLQELHSLLGQRTERLFSGRGEDLEYSTNRWNGILKRFCEITGLPFRITQYTGRKTLIANVVRTVTNGLAAAQAVMDHVDRGTTAGYGLSNPFVREEIYAECLEGFRNGTRTLLETTIAAGGRGLGGNAGRRLEERVAALAEDTGVVVPKTIDIFVEELIRQQTIPIPVAPGILCMKQGTVRGRCGDIIPHAGLCTAECTWQVQEMYRRELLLWEIEMARSGGLASSSGLQKTYWLHQMEDQLHAWPDLRHEFEQLLSDVPTLKGML